MTAVDLPAIRALLEAHYEGVEYGDDIPEGEMEAVPEDYERHYCHEDGEDWPCAAFIAAAPSIVAQLVAVVERVTEIHRQAKIYDECECPDGTHPEDYDFIDCDSYAGCENSLIGIGCEECCVSGGFLSEACGESHTHTMDPDKRCPTIRAITGEGQ